MEIFYKALLPDQSEITGQVTVENESLVEISEAIKSQNAEAHMFHYHIVGQPCSFCDNI